MTVFYPEIKKQILTMVTEDQKMRKEADKTGIWNYDIDKKNTSALKTIIKKIGFPTIKMVGAKASKGAWLIVQHADKDISFQKIVLKQLRVLYEENPKSICNLAIPFLTDRVLVNSHKKQIYGSQLHLLKNGKLVVQPIQNKKQVNTLRIEWNLPPIEEYLKSAQGYHPHAAITYIRKTMRAIIILTISLIAGRTSAQTAWEQ